MTFKAHPPIEWTASGGVVLGVQIMGAVSLSGLFKVTPQKQKVDFRLVSL